MEIDRGETKRKMKNQLDEKYRLLGEAIMREYFTHREKEIKVTFTDSPVLVYLSVSVDVHCIAVGFSERERNEMMKRL